MSKIDEQIKQLQLKKKKIEFFQHILQSSKDYKDDSFSEVKNDVISSLESFVKSEIEFIENGPKDRNNASISLSEENVETTKISVNEKKEEKQQSSVDNNDKLNFAINNRHLANKKVTVANNDNMVITGSVVGLDAPYVIVKTETGPTIRVPLERISLS